MQHLRVERDRRRDDQRADVEQGLPQRPRVAGQFGGIAHGMALAQPLHDLRFEWLNDQNVHAPFGQSSRQTHAIAACQNLPVSPALIVSKCT